MGEVHFVNVINVINVINVNSVIVFEMSVMRNMKTHNNCHNFVKHYLATTLTFFGTVFEQLFLPLGDNYFAKITGIAKQPQ